MSKIITHAERVNAQRESNDKQHAETYRRIINLAQSAEQRGDIVMAEQHRRQAGEYADTRMIKRA